MTSKRLVETMKEANTFAAVPSLSVTTDRDKRDELKDRLLDLVTYKNKIGTSLNVLYECSRDWTDGIDKLNERERQEELKLQGEFCKEENADYVVLLDEAQTLVDNLLMQEAALTRAIRALEKKIERATTGPPPATGATIAATAALPQVNLPLMDLPDFEGDVLKFAEFWDLFEATIDKNTVLGDRQKFSYLKTYLRGRAEKLIEGPSVTEGNYTVAKELLKDTYGKKDYAVQALYRELEQLRKPQSNAAALRNFMQELEKLCRQLEKHGEDLDQKQILVSLESKMPFSVLSEIAKAKNAGGTWTTKQLRELLKRAVELQETIESMSGVAIDNRTAHRGQRQRPRRIEDSYGEPNVRPSAAFAVGSNTRRPPPKCLLCDEQHWASDCQKYNTVQKRKERLRQLQRCHRCLHPGHTKRECKNTRPCYFCKTDDHHTALCSIAERQKKQSGSGKQGSNRATLAACVQDQDDEESDMARQLGRELADEA